MKKLLLGILFIVFVIGCGPKPEAVVTKFIDNVKEKKFDEANKYALNNELTDDVSLEYNNTFQQQLFEKLFENMKYEIIGTEKLDKETTVVTASVENIDTKKVFLDLFTNIFQNAFSNNKGNINIEEEFKSILEAENIPKSKNTTKFYVKKTKEGNKIDVSAENVDVLFGKLISTLSNLDQLGEDENHTGGQGENTGAANTNGANNAGVNNVNNSANNGTAENHNKDNKTEQKTEGPKAGTEQKLTEPTLNKK